MSDKHPKRGRGRSPGVRYTRRLVTYLTDAQADAVEAAAKLRGVLPATWIRQAITGRRDVRALIRD